MRGDRALLRVALVNLLSNAVKYTRPPAQAVIEVGGQPMDRASRPRPSLGAHPPAGWDGPPVVLFVRWTRTTSRIRS